MPGPARAEITRILLDLPPDGAAHAKAADRIFQLVYDELHLVARNLMRRERTGHTLQATALVHEAYVRLVDGSRIEWQNRVHFFAVAARAMRQILVDHARERMAAKRGGDWQRVTLDERLGVIAKDDQQLLDIHDALGRLAESDERMARIVELRVFGGLTAQEVAAVLGISRSTVQGEWRVAKMWLARELTHSEGP